MIPNHNKQTLTMNQLIFFLKKNQNTEYVDKSGFGLFSLKGLDSTSCLQDLEWLLVTVGLCEYLYTITIVSSDTGENLQSLPFFCHKVS